MTLQRGWGLQSVNRVMGNDERTKIDRVCDSEGDSSCVFILHQGSAVSSQLRWKSRRGLRHATQTAGLRKHALKGGVCVRVFVSYSWFMLNRCITANLSDARRVFFCEQRFYLTLSPRSGGNCGIQQSQHPPRYTRVTFCEISKATHTYSTHVNPRFTSCSLQGFSSEQHGVTVNRHLAVVLVGQLTRSILGRSYYNRSKRLWLCWDLDKPLCTTLELPSGCVA